MARVKKVEKPTFYESKIDLVTAFQNLIVFAKDKNLTHAEYANYFSDLRKITRNFNKKIQEDNAILLISSAEKKIGKIVKTCIKEKRTLDLKEISSIPELKKLENETHDFLGPHIIIRVFKKFEAEISACLNNKKKFVNVNKWLSEAVGYSEDWFSKKKQRRIHKTKIVPLVAYELTDELKSVISYIYKLE